MPKEKKDFEVYLVYVDPEKCECDGSGLCKFFCPCDVFEITDKAYPVRPRSCLGCRTCEAVC